MRDTAARQPSAFGAQLRHHRESAGLSQEELAERAGLTAKAIGALERGERRRPYPHTIQLLADALGLDEPSRSALIVAARHPAPTLVDGDGFFVGRARELERLQACWDRVAAGGSGIVTVVGEAGIGKTSVARAFGAAATRQRAMVLWGRSFEGDWQPPYGPWVDAITRYASGVDPERIRAELGQGAPSIARVVPGVRAVLPDLPDPPSLASDDERLRLFDAIGRFLLAVSERQPVLLVLDDLHWADLDSLRLLRHVTGYAGLGRVLILGTYRDPEIGLTREHPLRATLGALRRETHYEQIDVSGLAPDDLAAYLENYAGAQLSRDLVRLIAEETRGNPFYAGELVRDLAEGGTVLAGASGEAEVSIQAVDVPAGVREVVGTRVARLSGDTRLLLSLAAGLGAGFDFDILEQLTELSEDTLLGCLDEALEAGLIRVATDHPPTYEFVHAIVRHALYRQLNPDRRARLHRRIAIALERAYADRELEHAAAIAAHYHASASVPGADKGVRYALAVAWQAKAAFAHERAVAFLRMARDLAVGSPPSERAEILRRLALAEADALRLDEARASGELAFEAMQLAEAEPHESADFLATLARALKDAGASAMSWESLVDRGLALVGTQRGLAWARLELLRDHYEPIQSGPIRAGRWLGRDPQAVAIARLEGDEDDYARTLDYLDWRTRGETESLLALVRTWSRPPAIIRGLEVAGRDLMYRHGAFAEARKVFEDLLEASERFGSLEARGDALAHIGATQCSTGDLTGLRESLRRASEAIAGLGASHRLKLITTSLAVGLAYFVEGDWERLSDAAKEHATSDASLRSPVGLIAASYVGLCAARAGHTSEARRWIEHVVAASEAIPATTYAQNWVIARCAAVVWEIEAAEYAPTTLRLLAELARAGVGDPGVFGPLDLSLARMAAMLGDGESAERHFERAITKLEALGHGPAKAIAEYDFARALQRTGKPEDDRIRRLADQAVSAFDAYGMAGWVARSGPLRDSLGERQRP
jgi:transcriptional regulator with XRE-family HTH domain/tetratricopeptide (TPR) repeat protein